MAKKGYIYKGLKPVYWSPSSESALAEAEIEYQDKRSASIYVRLMSKMVKVYLIDDENCYLDDNTLDDSCEPRYCCSSGLDYAVVEVR